MDTNVTGKKRYPLRDPFGKRKRYLFWLGLIIVMLGASSCGSNPLARPVSNQPTPTPALGIGVVNTPQVVGSPEPSSPIHIKTPLAESTQEATVGPAAETPTIQLPTFTPTWEPSSTPSLTPTEPKSSSDGVVASPTPVLYPTTTWKPPQITAADVPDDWLTYVDEEAGYSFKYPPEATFSSGSMAGDKYKYVDGFLANSNESRPYVVVIVTENSDDLTLEQYLCKRYVDFTKQSDVPSEYLAVMERMEINGFPAIWSKAEGDSEVFIVIRAEDKIFNFILSNAIMVDDMRKVNNTDKNTFYQILNTFTTIKK